MQGRPLQPARVLRPGGWFFAITLAWALLLAQTMGLMHGVVHGNGRSAQEHPPHSLAHPDSPGHPAHDNWLTSLFSSHDSEPDCRLYDQASHGSAAPAVASASLPEVLPSRQVAIFQGEALARWSALFDARGPPLTL